MKKHVFPPEVIEFSSENHFVRNHSNSRIIYQISILLLIIVLGLLPFIDVDITTQGRGVIRTPYENSVLQTTISGEIERAIVEENRRVHKGDTLLLLRTDQLNDEVASNRAKLEDNLTNIEDVNLLIADKSPKAYRFLSEYREFLTKKSELSTQVLFAEKEVKRAETLFQRSVISEADYLQEKNRFEMATKQRDLSLNEYRNRWQTEKKRMELENFDLTSRISRLIQSKRSYAVVATADGSIIQTSGLQVGSFINSGQKIGFLSQDENLIAECYIKPKDIGFIRMKQRVEFQIDAFNYREWGVVTGSVVEVSNDVFLLSGNESAFRVRCQLDKGFLLLHNNYRGNLKKGMSLTGQFYLTKRSIAQLLFDKMDDWMNPTQTK
ncbi:MAG: HlyD family secretion protein [Bacteroidales bacterium]